MTATNVEEIDPPKAAQELISTAEAAGWKTACLPGKDSAGDLFITIEVGAETPEGIFHYKVTWHTRETGSLRLFGKVCRTPGHWWHYAPSLKAIRETIKAHPVVDSAAA